MKLLPRPAFRMLGALLSLGSLLGGMALVGCGKKPLRTRPVTSLSAADRQMLDQYEEIRAALAKDDFRLAKRKAASFQTEVGSQPTDKTKTAAVTSLEQIATAISPDLQRDAFRTWSTQAIAVTNGVSGFYVIHCPIPNCGDWLQKDAEVDNPYMGKVMHDCGEIEK